MFEAIFGNGTVEKVLLFLWRYRQGYPKEIADTFKLPVNAIQQQLRRLEEGNVVVNRKFGRTRVYELNPRYPLRNELLKLMEKIFAFIPPEQVQTYYSNRTRPRRAGKP